jgi:hypothetical protein
VQGKDLKTGASPGFRTLRPYILLFCALSVIYHSNLRPVASGDSLPAALIPFSLLLDHTVNLDRFGPWLRAHVPYTHWVLNLSGGHYYSYFPIAGGVLVTPLYLPLLLFRGVRDWDAGSLVALARILEKFAASAVAAFSALALLALLKRVTSGYWAWRLTLVYALGTMTWSISSQALWQHTTGQLAIACALWFLKSWSEDRDSTRALWFCGACVGCALMIRPSNALLWAAVMVGLFSTRARVADYIRFSALPLGGALLIAGYNLYVFRTLSGNYPISLLTGNVLKGLAGVLISPGRGLLVYIPFAIFAVCALMPAAADGRTKHTALLWASLAFVVLQIALIAQMAQWWGGYCWSPRYLSEIMPPLIILIALGTPLLERRWLKRSFVLLATYSILIQALGVYFYPKGHWDSTPVSVDDNPARLWDWRDNPIRRTLEAGPAWEPYAIVGAALTGGRADAERKMHELNVNPY